MPLRRRRVKVLGRGVGCCGRGEEDSAASREAVDAGAAFPRGNADQALVDSGIEGGPVLVVQYDLSAAGRAEAINAAQDLQHASRLNSPG